MADSNLVVGIDLGGTSLRAALVDAEGNLLSRTSRPTEASRGLNAVLDNIVGAVNTVTAGAQPGEITALGLGAPGPLDPVNGIIFSPPNLPGWKDVPLKGILEQRLGLPVFLGNDANLAAMGEHRFGAGRGFRHLIYITVSTGIGGGIIVDGKLLLGSRGLAGEVGHMTIDVHGPRCACGNTGCLEALASGTAIARQAQELVSSGIPSRIDELAGGDIEAITTQTVVAAAREGDGLALELMERAGTRLGFGVVSLVHLFNPEIVVIGGGVSNAGPLLFDPVRRVVNSYAMTAYLDAGLEIVQTQLGDDVGLLGAVALALSILG